LKAVVSSEEASQALEELQTLFSALEAAGFAGCVQLDLSVVRGLAYYTGIVFEVFDKNKSMRAIAGGGRYDNLCEKLGGTKVTAVGFGMGDVVLADLLSERSLLSETQIKPDIFVASFSGDMNLIFKTASIFRKSGFSVTHALSPLKLGKQMEQANAAAVKMVVYADGEKAAAGEFEYKVLADGTQGAGTLQAIRGLI
jgi:histidyl-tRNA synthetase